ncbi:hypothetical protein C0585_06985 [Candidatus Woesearchaeota archaeon]|nr:MAG: hypothetical protein C0585_06985 [Candidatus Woesearchaeota archaeon]
MDPKTLYDEEQKKKIAEFNDEVDDFASDLETLYQEIIEVRKSGRDPLIAEYMYRSLKSKLLYLRKSEDIFELGRLRSESENIKKEIQEARNQEIINVKKEIDQRLKKQGVHYIGEIKDED